MKHISNLESKEWSRITNIETFARNNNCNEQLEEEESFVNL